MFDESLLESGHEAALVQYIFGDSKMVDFGDGLELLLPVSSSINKNTQQIAMLWIVEDPDFPDLSIYDYREQKLYELDGEALIDTGIVEVELADQPGVIKVRTVDQQERICSFDTRTRQFNW